MSAQIHDIEVETLTGETKNLAEYEGRLLLIVNTASKCGLTPQFAGLEELQQEYGDRGLTVLGFPCNQFANQDPGSNEQIGEFCQRNYGVSFPMHGKLKVNGPGTHPLFKHLKKEKPGLLGIGAIKWNFTKFLVDGEGRVVQRFGPKVVPRELRKEIERHLPRS
jgi:glutathione peroxidase